MNELRELRKYLRAVLSWWWLIVLITAAATTASYIVSSRQPRVYQATTTVIVGQSIQVNDPTTQDIDTSRRLAQTYALIIRRQPIMRAVVDSLNLDKSWRELRSQTTVYLVPSTQLIEISVEGSSPRDARIIADEIARQFILYTPTLDSDSQSDETRTFVEDRMARLKEKILARQAEVDRKEIAYINAGLESERQAIQNEISRLESIIGTWESNYSRLLAVTLNEEDSNYVAVIEPAQAGNSPVRPDIRTNTVLASAVGVLLALVVVFLLEYLDDTLKSEEALEQDAQLIPLGMVNQMKAKRGKTKLITSHNPFSVAQEAYRMIRSNIQFMSVDQPRKTIMITSANPSDGKSLTAANLSLTMAQAGLRTILVDADLRQPKQHTLFNINNRIGLTDVLAPSHLDLNKVLRGTSVENLLILPSGTRPPNPTELLGSQKMAQLLEALSAAADVVILDSMPVLPVADAVVLSNRVDGVVLVVDSTRTRRSDLKKAIQILRKADAKILGAVLNRVPSKMTRYYSKEYVPYAERKRSRLRSIWRSLTFSKK